MVETPILDDSKVSDEVISVDDLERCRKDEGCILMPSTSWPDD